MESQPIKVLDLDTLDQGIPAIPPDSAGWFKGHCLVRLDEHGHTCGVLLRAALDKGQERQLSVRWTGQVDDRLRAACADEIESAEYGATALAFLLTREVTPYTAVQRARIGGHFDFYLARRNDQNGLIFNDCPRLEVSGIVKESRTNTVLKRARQKVKRLAKDGVETYIVVVEFYRPQAVVVKTHERD